MKQKKVPFLKFTRMQVVPHWFGNATIYALSLDGLIYSADFKKTNIISPWKISGAFKGEGYNNIVKKYKEELKKK